MTMETIEVHKSEGLKNEDFTVVVRGRELADRLAEQAGLPRDGAGPAVELRVDGKRVARAECVGVWGGPAQQLPASVLERHHDPACRSFSGFALVMACLAQQNLLGQEEVSAVMLRPLPESRLEVVPASRLTLLGGP